MRTRILRRLAMLAFALFALEGVSFLVLRLLELRDRGLPSEALAPAYRELPWAETYWREHKRFLAQSFENHPYGLWRLRPFAGETINVGADGFRRTEFVDCDGDAPRIDVYGSSAVWGQGSPDAGTIPSLLARRFADAGLPVCVRNRGTDAWRSSESVIDLVQELRAPGARMPAAVVFVDSCNDVFTPFLYTGAVERPYNFEKTWLDRLATRHRGGFGYLEASNAWTLAQRLLRRARGTALPASPVEDPDRLGREVVEHYLANVRIVDGLARSHGFAYEFFWLPLHVEGMDAAFRSAVEHTAPRVRALSVEHVHDLGDAYGKELALDACHLLPAANRIVADAIYERIGDAVRAAPPR